MAKNNEARVTLSIFNQDFNKAVNETKQETQKLNKEFELQKQEMKMTASESEKLAAKIDYLTAKQELASRTTADTIQQYERVKVQFGENSQEAQKMAAAVMEAKIAEQKLANELTATNKALDAAKQEQSQIAESTKQLEALFKATGNSIDNFSSALGDKLTNAIKSGTASSKQLEDAISKIGQASLGAEIDIDKLKKSLSTIDSDASIDQLKKDLSALSEEANQTEKSISNLDGVISGLATGGGIAGAVSTALDAASLNTKLEISMDVAPESMDAVKASVSTVTAYIGDQETAIEGVRRQWALNKDASDESNAAVVKGAAAITKAYSGVDFTELIQEANEIGASLFISNEEAMGLVNSLLKAGFPPEQLDTIAEYGQQMTDAGFSAKEIQAIFEAGIDTKTWNIDNLNDGVKEARIQMATFGLEVPKAMKPLLADADMSVEKFKAWGAAIAAGGEQGSQAMSEMVTWLDGIQDKTVKNELATKIFGTKWEDQGANLLAVFNGIDGAIDQTAQNTDGLNQQIQKIDADPMVKLSEASSNVKTALAPALGMITDLVWNTANWAKNNPQLTASIVAIVAAIGILAGLFVTLTPAIAAVVELVGSAGLSSALAALTGPIGITIAAIVLLVTAFVTAYTQSETFRDKVQAVFEKIKEVAMNVFQVVASFIGEKIAQIKQFWNENGTQILQAVTNVFNGIKAVIDFVMPAVKLVIQTIWGAIKDVISGALNIIMGAVKIFSGLFTGDWSKMWEGVKQLVSGAIKLILGWLTLSFFGGIKTVLLNLSKNGISIIKTMWDDILAKFKGAGSSAKQFIDNLLTAAKTSFTNMKTAISTKMSEVKTAITTKWDEAVQIFKNAPSKLVSIGKDVVNGLIKGIKEKFVNITATLSEMADLIPNWVKDALGIKSPSRVMMEVGKWVPIGLAEGIANNQKFVDNAMKSITNSMKSIAKSYAAEEKKITKEANADIAQIQKRAAEDIEKIERTAKAKKRKLTQDELIKIERIEENAAQKITAIKQKSSNQLAALDEKERKDRLEKIKAYIENKKSLEQISLVEEAAIWQRSINQFKAGTKERIDAQNAYKNAAQAIQNEIVSINQNYQSQMQQIHDNLAQQEADLTQKYQDAVENRRQALMGFASLFEAFKMEVTTSGTELLGNLQSQVDGFKTWQTELDKLSQRGVSGDLLAELQQMGPKALPELMALNTLTDEQLTTYSNLFQEKAALARSQAEAELVGMKTDMETQIEEMRKKANSKLDTLNLEWQGKIKALTGATSTELASLHQIGIDAGTGLLNGLSSMQGPLIAKATEIANAIKATIQSALDIHSPSRVMRGFGVNIGEGLILGMDDMLGKVSNSAQRLAQSVESNAGSRISNSYDYSKSFAPNVNIYTQNSGEQAMDRTLRRLAYQF